MKIKGKNNATFFLSLRLRKLKMKQTNLNNLTATLLTFAFGFLFFTATTANAAPDQARMKSARSELQQAKNNLQNADKDKGGHRAKAVRLVDKAIAEVNKGIAYDRNHRADNSSNIVYNGNYGGRANEYDQRSMNRAKDNLQDALNDLERATQDKGGHRSKAMKYVREAIDEVNKGIRYDRRN